MSPVPARRGPARGFLLALALLALGAPLLGEGGMRAWLRLRGRPWSSAEARTELLAAVDAMTQPLPSAPEDLDATVLHARSEQVVHPYLGFDTRAGVETTTEVVRSLRAAPEGGEFRVLVLGGSVSGMVAKNGSAALRAALAADGRLGEREVVVINQGRGSFKEPQQVLLLTWLLALGAAPEAVVNIDGFNEVALGGENPSYGVHPGYPHWPRYGFLTSSAVLLPEGLELLARLHGLQAEVRRLVEQSLEQGWLRSALLGRLALRRVSARRLEWVSAREELVLHLGRAEEGDPVKGPPFDPGQGLESCVRLWAESSLLLHELCQARGITYLHVLQPTLLDRGSKPLGRREAAIAEAAFPRTAANVARGYPELRRAGLELGARGVRWLDLSQLFASESRDLYIDICHFRPSGCERVGAAIGAALLEAIF
jgi:hypothetical protein